MKPKKVDASTLEFDKQLAQYLSNLYVARLRNAGKLLPGIYRHKYTKQLVASKYYDKLKVSALEVDSDSKLIRATVYLSLKQMYRKKHARK